MPGKVSNVMLEKAGEDQLDGEVKIFRKSQGAKQCHTNNEKMEG